MVSFMFNNSQEKSYKVGDKVNFEDSNFKGVAQIVKFGNSSTVLKPVKVINVRSDKPATINHNFTTMNQSINSVV